MFTVEMTKFEPDKSCPRDQIEDIDKVLDWAVRDENSVRQNHSPRTINSGSSGTDSEFSALSDTRNPYLAVTDRSCTMAIFTIRQNLMTSSEHPDAPSLQSSLFRQS